MGFQPLGDWREPKGGPPGDVLWGGGPAGPPPQRTWTPVVRSFGGGPAGPPQRVTTPPGWAPGFGGAVPLRAGGVLGWSGVVQSPDWLLGLGTLVLAPDSPRHDGGGRGPKMSPASTCCAGSRLLGPAFGFLPLLVGSSCLPFHGISVGCVSGRGRGHTVRASRRFVPEALVCAPIRIRGCED